jgi:hypothetical protein
MSELKNFIGDITYNEGQAVFRVRRDLQLDIQGKYILATGLKQVYCDNCGLECWGITDTSIDGDRIKVGMTQRIYQYCPIIKSPPKAF